MNIFDFPLYYISFKRNEELENKAKALGFTNINHFQAIDGRKFEPKKLLGDNIITIRSYYDLVDTRTQHSGLPGLGAVGCTMSHNKLWQKCVDNIKSGGHVCFNISSKMYDDAVKYGLTPCDIEEDLLQQLGQQKGKKKQDKIYIWRC